MIRGRKPKPTALKVLAGNPGKRPINANEPKPPPARPRCPAWLDAEAKREWRRIAPTMARMGLLTEVDAAVLAAYCAAVSELVRAHTTIAERGLSYRFPRIDESGKVVGMYMQQIPEVGILHRAQEEIRAFATLFGMSPSDRARIAVTEDDDDMFAPRHAPARPA